MPESELHCLLCDSSSCEHVGVAWITMHDCDACAQAPERPPCRLCAEHGCAAGCGMCMLSDGPYCGGEDGEECDVYGRVADA